MGTKTHITGDFVKSGRQNKREEGKEEGGEGRRGGRKGGEEVGRGSGEVHSIIKVRVYMCEWVSEGWVSEGG